MRAIIISCIMIVALSASADCDNSVLVIHSKRGEPLKVYLDGSTGTNAPTVGVSINGIPPGEHLVKVVAEYTDAYGHINKHTIFNGNVNFRGSRYMDGWIEEGKGISVHETVEPCNGELPEGSEPPFNPSAPKTQNNTAPAPNNVPADNAQAANNSAPVDNSSTNQVPAAAPANDSDPNAAGYMPAHISDNDFEQLKNTIMATQYEIKKMDTLKALVPGDLFTTAQVGILMNIFTFESNKLDIAKLLYSQTVDPANYDKLENNFNFDAGKGDFKKFMNGQ
jgi:hypothetical protein